MTPPQESKKMVNEISISDIPNHKILTDSEVVKDLYHEKKAKILALLVEHELTIIEIKNKLNINPGTIKRHLDSLVISGLVEQTRKVRNEYGIMMKFYRATAQQFEVRLHWNPKRYQLKNNKNPK